MHLRRTPNQEVAKLEVYNRKTNTKIEGSNDVCSIDCLTSCIKKIMDRWHENDPKKRKLFPEYEIRVEIRV